MSTTVDLNEDGNIIDTGNDSIVIVRHLDSIRGGRSLNVTGFTPKVISAGHLIIQDPVSKDFKPMPINAGATAYAALPADHIYVGVLIASILTKRPFAAILTNGTVNPVASPFAPPAGAITALTQIQFRAD
ncbi:hypothetical protein [Pedobacter nototheniae]|uniref:hypothetical protein n=1 Tax=Pedobacter nototheniae TaxID=2488994 RepID=UPI0010407403|nr:hypothetical protein [Pedobacter nototheniae]